MGYGFKIIAEGDYACFTRPEQKVERVSYDVPTPGALEGMIKCIYWKPAIRYVIDRIVVFNPIEFENIRRNEVKEKISFNKVKSAMNGGESPEIFTKENISQRAGMVLKNVRYGIEFHFEMTGLKSDNEDEGEEKHYNTEAFNYLTSHTDPNTQKFTNKAYIDSMTVIFFAADKNSEKEDAFLRCFAFDDSVNSDVLEPQIRSVMGHIQKGDAVDMNEIVTDGSADYYVAGLVPNSSRVCMKFCYRDSFGKILENVLRHQRDISMGVGDRPVTVSQLTAELVSPVSKDQAPPPLISALMDSIFLGRRYPDSLLAAVINRVKTDSDTEDKPYRKINSRRVGIIKACLNRNYKEEFTVALDENRKDKAYLCGRLFAVLEKIQRDAQGKDLNTTIKDSYFAAACSKPSVVFPKLIMLAQNHLKKLDSDYYNYLMGEIINLIEGNFPAALSIEEQGAFIIGYYQQFFLKKKSDDSSDKE